MPKPPVTQITEKLLIDAGGWQAIKHARALIEMGRVFGANWSPPLLKGSVREGETEYSAGLKIRTHTDVENLCTCRASRQWGTICAHSLAVGLAIVAGQNPPPSASASSSPNRPASPSSPSTRPASQEKAPPPIPFRVDEAAEARLHIVLAPDLAGAWKKRQLLVGLEVEAGNRRALIDPPKPSRLRRAPAAAAGRSPHHRAAGCHHRRSAGRHVVFKTGAVL